MKILYLIKYTYMAKDKKIHIPISKGLKADAQRIAQQRDMSLAALVRYLIRKETDKE